MPRSSRISRIAPALLSATLLSLSGCSQQPVRPGPLPQVIQCPQPTISPELLVPPDTAAINRLLIYLALPPLRPVSAGTPLNDSRPFKPK